MKVGQHQEGFLAGILCLLAAGIAAERMLALPLPPLAFSAAALAVLCLWMVRRGSLRAWMALGLLFFVVGMLRYAGAEMLPASDISRLAGQEVHVAGVLSGEPQIEETAEGTWKARYEASVQSAVVAGREEAASGGIYIYARAKAREELAAEVGDAVEAAGVLRRPHGYGNPGQLDTALLLRTQGITAQLMAGKAGVRTSPGEDFWFARQMARLRAHYRAAMEEAMPQADAAAIFAMLFGGYGGIRPELLEAFTATGIVHILSVSGSHISLMAAVMAWLANALRLPRLVGAGLVLGMIFVYSALAGFVPPVLRAALMGGLSFLAAALGREKEARRILLVTGLLLLLLSPLLLFHISFQLSFAATAGLLYIAPVVRERLAFLPEAAAGSLAITLGAQLSTLPLLAWYFHQVSLSSLLANLIVVPVVEGMIVLGLLAGAAAFLLPFLGRLAFAFDSLLLGLVYEMTRALAKLPGSQVYLPTMGAGACALYAVLLGYALQAGERREAMRRWLWERRREGACLAAGVLLLAGAWRLAHPPELAVHFIDVGQGDAALVVTPHGHAFLFDAGGTRDGAFDVGARVDVPYLWHYGVRKLDGIFLSHAHEDHAAGAGSVLRLLPVGHVFTAGEGREAYLRSMRLPASAPEAALLGEATEGMRWEVDGAVIEAVFAPEVTRAAAKTGNEASNVYRVRYGDASFLFTGDLTAENEKRLLAEGKDVRSTVLKVGHHGSATSSSDAFLAAVAPRWAVFCVGRDNTFGHPKPGIVQKFREAGVRTYRTDEDGAVVFYTDGHHMRVEPYRRK